MLEELIGDITADGELVIYLMLVVVVDSDDGVVEVTQVGIVFQIFEFNFDSMERNKRSGIAQTALTLAAGVFGRVGAGAEHIGIRETNRSRDIQILDRLELHLERCVVADVVRAIHDRVVVDAVVVQVKIGFLDTTANGDIVIGIKVIAAKGSFLPIVITNACPIFEH